jgi:co-chaperonin GroES (HSP10)
MFENTSGICNLCEYKCLVLPDPVEDKTEGGILYKPDIAKEREKYRTCKATFILAAKAAFQDFGKDGNQSYIPQPGDRVYVAVAAGMFHYGPDGKEYRLVNDKDVVGQLDE